MVGLSHKTLQMYCRNAISPGMMFIHWMLSRESRDAGFVLVNMCKSSCPVPDRTPDSILRHKIFATTASHKVKISPGSRAQCSLLHNTSSHGALGTAVAQGYVVVRGEP